MLIRELDRIQDTARRYHQRDARLTKSSITFSFSAKQIPPDIQWLCRLTECYAICQLVNKYSVPRQTLWCLWCESLVIYGCQCHFMHLYKQHTHNHVLCDIMIRNIQQKKENTLNVMWVHILYI